MGDDALQQIAEALASTVRRLAVLFARYGGEDFVPLLPETNGEAAKEIALRALKLLFLRHRVLLCHVGRLMGKGGRRPVVRPDTGTALCLDKAFGRLGCVCGKQTNRAGEDLTKLEKFHILLYCIGLLQIFL